MQTDLIDAMFRDAVVVRGYLGVRKRLPSKGRITADGRSTRPPRPGKLF
jgi:hypothetical protein